MGFKKRGLTKLLNKQIGLGMKRWGGFSEGWEEGKYSENWLVEDIRKSQGQKQRTNVRVGK